MTKLRECCLNITDGEHGSVTDDVNGTCFLLSNKNIIDGKIVISDNDRRISIDVWRNINKRTKLESGDVLISTVGTLGKTAIVKGEVNYDFQRSVGIIKCNKNKLLNKFLYYYLNLPHVQNKLVNTSKGAVQKCIFINDLKDFDIDIPDVENQQQIIDVLSALDDKIELNNKVNQELEKTAKDLYNYWFVQFDFPDGNKRPYKSSGGKMVYNDVLKREIPEGWTVENIADNKLSKILKPGIKQFDGQKIYLPTAAVENDRIIDKSNLITYDNREGRANMEPVDNSVWFAKMKNTKKVLYFGDYSSQRISQTILSTGMLGLKCVENALEYIWNFVNDDFFEAVKNKLSHGATQEGVNNDDLLYFPMLIPSIETLRDYSVLVKDLYKQKYFNEIENECLAELRDFLLPMLMNGQVSVS